ncbi:uncharacterized protein LOC126554963 [Aphis gossypii]|uniref:uncharacterized protein LOC126554963 n=1 Tax=Aphis gossypii TaxID=80765 RepID=UPI002158BA47|nr:uncharacterized protein LOC126554963 [Aphis gossypii]
MAKKSMTPSQKEALVEFMENHPDLRKGKFSINFTTAIAKKMWVECQTMLNSIPGPAKEWHEWRKTWQDLKAKTKKKKSDIKSDFSGTGGGPPQTDQLDSVEERILCTIGEVPISGDPYVHESTVSFDHQDSKKCVSEFVDPLDMPATSSNFQYLQPAQTSQINSEILDTQPAKVPFTELSQLKRVVKFSKADRLNNTVEATNKLNDVSAARNSIVESYYNAKIELLKKQTEQNERMVIAKERSAIAKERSAIANEAIARALAMMLPKDPLNSPTTSTE